MWSEKMMFEGDIREEYVEWLSKMKNATIIPDSGAAITISKNVERDEIDFPYSQKKIK
jgi:hypothetical protein|tara:strand:+ start:436 stop:609 length:174 start_codon:yes stop_codon:yes gene_type:complete